MSEGPFEGGFGLPIPGELAEAIKKHHDQMHMSAQAEEARVDAFLSGLDVEGLMTLRAILNAGDMPKSLTANFYDGQITAIMQHVHKVDPRTGKDPLDLGEVGGGGS